VVLSHVRDKIGGGMTRAIAPVDEKAVGPTIEHAVEPDRLGLTQAAAVVVARDIESGVQPRLDRPVVNIGAQLLPG